MALEPVMTFTSPTRGRLDFDTLFYDIINYMQEAPDSRYRVIIGTDSQFAEETCFVTAIIVHREGKGARYYYTRDKERVSRSLRQRIYYETSRSLGVASLLTAQLAENGTPTSTSRFISTSARTGRPKELIREVVGMVVGSGFNARIKPYSYGASKVADKYTK